MGHQTVGLITVTLIGAGVSYGVAHLLNMSWLNVIGIWFLVSLVTAAVVSTIIASTKDNTEG